MLPWLSFMLAGAVMVYLCCKLSLNERVLKKHAEVLVALIVFGIGLIGIGILGLIGNSTIG